MKNEESTEAMIQAKGLASRRLTPADIDAAIKTEQFMVFPGSTTTICLLRLVNGFSVTGESACVSPENFNQEIGEKVARENARAKIWPLEGYRLQEACYRGRELESYDDLPEGAQGGNAAMPGQEEQDSLDIPQDGPAG